MKQVVIIGAGIVGLFIAYNLKITLIENHNDVAEEISKEIVQLFMRDRF